MDKKTNKKLKTPDISTTVFDNVAFHVMETFSKDFLEVHGLRSRGFQLLQHVCSGCGGILKRSVQKSRTWEWLLYKHYASINSRHEQFFPHVTPRILQRTLTWAAKRCINQNSPGGLAFKQKFQPCRTGLFSNSK